MGIEHLLTIYGYILIILGTFFEGEALLIVFGLLAHQGYFHIYLVLIFAFVGAFLGDQFFFYLFRNQGNKIISISPFIKNQIYKVHPFFDKFHSYYILFFRFIYGIRYASLFLLSTSKIKHGKFIILNAISLIVWTLIFGMLGYFLGQTAELIFGKIKGIELILSLIILSAVILIWIIKIIKDSKLQHS